MSRTSAEPAEPAEGAILLPRRASFWAAAGLVVTLIGYAVVGATWYNSVENRFRELDASDLRQAARSNERYQVATDRISSLEKGSADTSGRLIRLEEQVKIGNDLLREIREALRSPARR